MTEKRATYYLLSGEGELGTWAGPFHTTERGARQRAARERCHGDRWCRVFARQPETRTCRAYVVDIDNSDVREVPQEAAR